MFALLIIINGIEVARQYHATYEDAMVAAMNLKPAVELDLKVIHIERD